MAKIRPIFSRLLKVFVLLLYLKNIIPTLAESTSQSSGIDSCEQNMSEKFSARLCEMRQYIVIEEAGEENHLNCIFSELGYLTEKGQLNINRIMKDFETTNNLDDEVRSSVQECCSIMRNVTVESRKHFVFFECLLYSDSSQQWRDVIDFREIHGDNVPENGYNREEVVKAVKAIDDQLCPNSQCLEDEEDIGETNRSFSPDDALFVFSRCFDSHVNEKSVTRGQDSVQWINFETMDGREKCFIKCILESFGVYSPITRRFVPIALSTQFEDYGDYLNIQKEQVESLSADLQAQSTVGNSCEEVYSNFIDVYKGHREVIRKLFHHPDYSNSILELSLPHIKLPNETYPAFCERNYRDVLTGKLCEIRKFSHDPEHKNSLKELISCIFKGFRYLTPSNDINESEVRRDFQLIGKLNQRSRKDIYLCARKAQQACKDERAYFLYGCLLNSVSSDEFKEAFENKEIISGDYVSVIRGVAYDRQQIRAKILQIDGEICAGENKE